MSDALAIMFSGFWPFVGSIILIWLLCRVFIYTAIGAVTAYAVTIKALTPDRQSADWIVKIIRTAIDDGKLDAPMSRVINRNSDRGS